MYDVIVIGGGAAGMNAALYALRGGKKVLVIEGEAIGGQIANSPKVENFPTVKEIAGTDFADAFCNQITDWGAEIEYDRVVKVEKNNDFFRVVTEYGEFCSKTVIAAVGVKHKLLNVSGESELIGKGVYFCALCDGPFYKGKDVAVIGDGNTAMQYALSLSGICSKVYILTLFDKFFGDKLLEKRLRETSNINIIPNVSVSAFCGGEKLEKIEYTPFKGDEKNYLQVPAAFVAIGQVPDNGIFTQFADVDAQGYFVANDDMSTKTQGFFVAGDCRKKTVRQLATAISDGAVAAVSACNFIEKQG